MHGDLEKEENVVVYRGVRAAWSQQTTYLAVFEVVEAAKQVKRNVY